jgi:membrane-bound ClpP family serine protease
VVEKPGQALEAYRLNPQTVRQAGPDWLDRVAAFLRQEWVRVILIGLGIACLILELKMPGVGLPGVISGICFILFFWAHAQLPFTWLAILAFLLGLVFIGLEIFVVPGFGVLGVSGIVLVLGGLGLATMENWPQTDSDWADKLTMLGWFGLTLVGAMALAITVARYLPQIPYANRMVLVPPTEKVEGGDEEPLPVSARQVNLLGAIGVAATPLRPAGMVRFGDDYLDVVAEGSYVQPGARVQVVEIEGNRIVVKEV